MGSENSYQNVVRCLAEEFAKYPLSFVEETDLQFRLKYLLQDELGELSKKNQTTSDGEKKELLTSENASDDDEEKYKFGNNVNYKNKFVENSIAESNTIGRVHTEVELRGNNGDYLYKKDNKDNRSKRFDVVVFRENIKDKSIFWEKGSKKFPVNAISAVFEIKFVKNKPKFPTQKNVTNIELNDVEDWSNKDLEQELDLSSNKIQQDFDDLKKLGVDISKYFLLFSNYDYLYETGEKSEGSSDKVEKYREIGEKAKDWFEMEKNNEVNFYYVAPGLSAPL